MKWAITGGVVGFALAIGILLILGITGVLTQVGDVWAFFIGFVLGWGLVNLGYWTGSTFDDY